MGILNFFRKKLECFYCKETIETTPYILVLKTDGKENRIHFCEKCGEVLNEIAK